MFFLLLRSFLFKIVVVSFLIYLHIRRAYFHMCLTTTENRHPFREWLSLCTLLTYGSLYVRSLPILWMCVQGFRDVFMNKSNYSRPVFRKYVYNTVIHWIRMDWYAARIRSVLGGIHWNSQFIASTFNFSCAHALTLSLSLIHSPYRRYWRLLLVARIIWIQRMNCIMMSSLFRFLSIIPFIIHVLKVIVP